MSWYLLCYLTSYICKQCFVLRFTSLSVRTQWSVTYKDTCCRAVEIPCPTCPTRSHFIQDKSKISIYLSMYKVNTILYFIFWLIIRSSHLALKTVSILISWLLQLIWIYTVFKRSQLIRIHTVYKSWYIPGFLLERIICNLFKHWKV